MSEDKRQDALIALALAKRGGIAVENAGVPLGGGPFETVDLAPGLTGFNAGGRVVRVVATPPPLPGVALRNAGVPLAGGPFTTFNLETGLSAANAGAGVANLTSAPLYTLAPSGGNDVLNVLAPVLAHNLNAPKIVRLLPGVWNFNMNWYDPAVVALGLPFGIPSNTTMRFDLGASIAANLATGIGGDPDSVFWAVPSTGLATTLTSDVAIYDQTIHVAAPIPLGQDIHLVAGATNRNETYKVIGVSGGGLDLLLDREVLRPYSLATALVQPVLYQPTNISIIGPPSRTKVSGVARSVLALVSSVDCLVEGIEATSLTSFEVFLLDAGGLRNTLRNVRAQDVTLTVGAGSVFHPVSNEEFVLEDYGADNTTLSANSSIVRIDDVTTGTFQRGKINAVGGGDSVIAFAADSGYGSTDIVIDDTEIVGAVCHGIKSVGDAHQGIVQVSKLRCRNTHSSIFATVGAGYQVSGVYSEPNTTDAEQDFTFGPAVGEVELANAWVNGARRNGFLVQTPNARGSNLRSDAQAGLNDYQFLFSGGTWTNLSGSGAAAISVTDASTAVTGVQFTRKFAPASPCFYVAAAAVNSRLLLRDVDLTEGATTAAGAIFAAQSAAPFLATLTVDGDVSVHGASLANVQLFALINAGMLRNKAALRTDGPGLAAYFFTNDGNKYTSRTNAAIGNTIGLTGAVPVAFAFPDLTADDLVVCTRKTAGGGAVRQPIVTQTPGVGYRLVSVATDNGTVDCAIV